MNTKTRILAMFLCVVLILGIVPIQVLAEEDTYTVTFDMNYTGKKDTVVEVKAGETVEPPKTMIRFAHDFVKWTTDEAGTTDFDFAAPITGDITLYAQWRVNYEQLAAWEGAIRSDAEEPDEPEQDENPDEEEQPDTDDNTPDTVNFGIGKFLFDENQSVFLLNYNATSESYLLFSVLNDDETKILYTDTIQLETGRDIMMLQYAIDDSFTLPEYFYAQAVIVDENGKELCNSVYYVEKSSEYQKFISFTPEDFDSERVIIMEEDNTQNFAVVAEGVALVHCGSDITLVIKNGTYCLEGNVASLRMDET